MSNRRRLFHIDDNKDFLELFALIYKPWFDVISSDSFIDFKNKLNTDLVDLVVTDYDMPETDGLEVLSYVKENYPDLPVIFYTGQGNEQVAREAFIAGAVDYFTKNFSDPGYKEKILNSISNAIEKRQLKRELKKSEELIGSILRSTPTGIGLTVNRVIKKANSRLCQITGYSEEELLNQNARLLYPTDEEYDYVGKEKYAQIAKSGTGTVETRWKRKNGVIIDVLLSSTPLDVNDLNKGVTFTALDITDRKKTEKSLKESHDRLLAIFDSIDEPVYVVDMETYDLVFANRVIINSFGLPDSRKCYKYLQNRETPCPFCSNSKLTGEYMGKSYVREFRNEINNRWYKCIDKAIHWPDGRLVRYEMAIDITNRKNTEKELQLNLDLLESTQQLAKIGGWEWDIDSRTMSWTTGTYSIHGLSPYEVEAGSPEHIQRSLACYDPEDQPVIEDAFRRCAEYGEPYDLEFPFTDMKGNRKWIQTVGKPVIKDNRIIKIIGNIIDITERKKTEEKLYLQSLVMDQIKDHVTITDLNGIITYVNKAQEEIFSRSKDEFIGRTTAIYGEDTEKGASQKDIAERTLRDGFWRGEVVNYSGDGSEVIMDCRTQVVYDEKGRPAALCGIATDITRRKRDEETLQRKNRELLDFAYTVSHDLKNPLNLLTGFLTVIQQDPTLFNQCFVKALHQIDKMYSFIDNLLNLSKAGLLTGETEIFQIEELFRTVYEVNKSDEIPSDLILNSSDTEFEGNKRQFEQLFTNLITNSIRYGDPSKDRVIIEFDCRKNNDGVFMSIKDNGMGIEHDELGKIFDVGYTTDKKAGNGFGLAIVRKIIEAYSGSIRAESEGKGKGTGFLIHIGNAI